MVAENGSFGKNFDSTSSQEVRKSWIKGKNALVTGGTRGIGAIIVQELAKEGANSLVVYSEKKNKKQYADEIEQAILPYDIHSEFIPADISTENGRTRIKDKFLKSFDGKLDILVLNAPVLPKPNEAKSPNESLTDDLLPLMSKGGVIIFMQSVPSHFEPQLKEELTVNDAVKIYATTAGGKHQDEQSLKARMEIFEKNGVKFIVVCPPLISDSTAIKTYFERRMKQGGNDNLDFSKESKRISRELGLPEEMSNEEAGKRTVQTIINKDQFEMGYVEFFK